MTDDAFLSPRLEIDPSFRDHNGHVNMAFHLVLADKALELAFAAFKGDHEEYVARRGLTTFTVEMHVRYLREMRMEDDVRGRVIVVDADPKRVRWAIELIRSSDGVVLTTVEGLVLSVSIETRKVTSFPADVLQRIDAVLARHARAAAGLDWLGGQVAMRRG